MGGLPIETKLAVKDADSCIGCKYLSLSTENDTSHEDTYTARCGKFKCQVRQWKESDPTPRLFPVGMDCKELPAKGD